MGQAAPDLSDIGDPTKMPDHEVTFSDVLSTLNPLQYIPVIGSIYRAVTGDTVSPAAQVVGGALLGGPMGLVASAANAILAQSTGKDVGDHLIAWLMPGSDKSAPAVQTQYAATGTTTTAAAASGAPASQDPAPSASPAAAVTAAPDAQPAAPSKDAATARAAATPAAAQDASAAPLSRALAGAGAPTSPAAAIAMGGAAGASKGWTLADYRGFAGHGLPPSAAANGAQLRNTPVPLQTTAPLPNEASRAPVVPAMVQTPANVAPAAAAAPATPQPQDTWVSDAMMRGLDRYRDMMRQQQSQQSPQQQQQQKPPASE